MTVSPDGLIIPTGVIGAPLTLLRDEATAPKRCGSVMISPP